MSGSSIQPTVLNMGLYADREIEAVNDYEVVFRLKQPNAFLLNNIARMPITPSMTVTGKTFVSAHRNRSLQTRFLTRDDRMVLVENEEYWGGKHP